MDWRDFQQSLGPTPPAGTQHYSDFEPRKNSRTGSAIFASICIAVLVVGLCSWLLVLRSCDPALAPAAWVF